MVVWSSAIFVFVLLAGLLELQACATLTISESEKKGTPSVRHGRKLFRVSDGLTPRATSSHQGDLRRSSSKVSPLDDATLVKELQLQNLFFDGGGSMVAIHVEDEDVGLFGSFG